MNDLQPDEHDHVDTRCPFCKADVPYTSMAWHPVITCLGQAACRRMGQCGNCQKWLKLVVAWPDEGHGRHWLLDPVDDFEREQVAKSKKPSC